VAFGNDLDSSPTWNRTRNLAVNSGKYRTENPLKPGKQADSTTGRTTEPVVTELLQIAQSLFYTDSLHSLHFSARIASCPLLCELDFHQATILNGLGDPDTSPLYHQHHHLPECLRLGLLSTADGGRLVCLRVLGWNPVPDTFSVVRDCAREDHETEVGILDVPIRDGNTSETQVRRSGREMRSPKTLGGSSTAPSRDRVTLFRAGNPGDRVGIRY